MISVAFSESFSAALHSMHFSPKLRCWFLFVCSVAKLCRHFGCHQGRHSPILNFPIVLVLSIGVVWHFVSLRCHYAALSFLACYWLTDDCYLGFLLSQFFPCSSHFLSVSSFDTWSGLFAWWFFFPRVYRSDINFGQFYFCFGWGHRSIDLSFTFAMAAEQPTTPEA